VGASVAGLSAELPYAVNAWEFPVLFFTFDSACNQSPRAQPCSMVAVLVYLRVKTDRLDQFLAETLENARNSRKEPGIVRFDLIQEIEDPSRFALFELYRDQQAIEAHRITAHYTKWREAVPPLLVTERTRTIYRPIEPTE
jgi:(4S)-4-hydroxy-5-phosphonooxypentane-2,3-dione isomerase